MTDRHRHTDTHKDIQRPHPDTHVYNVLKNKGTAIEEDSVNLWQPHVSSTYTHKTRNTIDFFFFCLESLKMLNEKQKSYHYFNRNPNRRETSHLQAAVNCEHYHQAFQISLSIPSSAVYTGFSLRYLRTPGVLFAYV